MKPYTKDEIKKAKKIAYRFVFSDYSVFMNFHREFEYDRRTRIGNLANHYVLNLKKNSNLNELKILKKKRRKYKQTSEFKNIFTLPIVYDYFKHKHNLKDIQSDRLEFWGRNHWAKTDKDLKIIKILSKHFINK